MYTISLPQRERKMYTYLPSIDSRLDAASVPRSSVDSEVVWKVESPTIPLLPRGSHIPLQNPHPPPIVLRTPTISWSPLPIIVREPRVTASKRKARRYSPSETMSIIRKWYRKHADADRFAYMNRMRGEKGTCHFCRDCGENHRKVGKTGIPLGGMGSSW